MVSIRFGAQKTLDEVAWIASWDKVKYGPKKRELEERLKKMKAMQAEFCMKRIGFTKVICKQDNESFSCKLME